MRRALFWLVMATLLLPAFAITAARLLQPSFVQGIQLTSFTPLAVVPYGLAVLLMLTRAVRKWKIGRHRALWGAAAALTAGLIGLHVWWWAPMWTGDTPLPADDAKPLTVMNANSLRGGIDSIGLVQAATERRVEVLVVEEITPWQLKKMEAAGLSAGWPYRVGEVDGGGVSRTMVFSRYPLTEVQRVATEFDSWTMTVQSPAGDLRLLAVHPYPPVDAQQWRRDLDAVVAAAPGADIVVGDCNATLDHAPLRALEDDGFRDAAELTNAGWQTTWPVNGKWKLLGIPVPPVLTIDHVFVGSRMTALWTKRVVLDGTDHASLLAQVALR